MLTNYYVLNMAYMLFFVLTMVAILQIFKLFHTGKNTSYKDDEDGLWLPADDSGFDLPPGVTLPDGGTHFFVNEPELVTV